MTIEIRNQTGLSNIDALKLIGKIESGWTLNRGVVRFKDVHAEIHVTRNQPDADKDRAIYTLHYPETK